MADDGIEQVAETASALSNSHRVQIILTLVESNKTLGQLHDEQEDLKYRDSTYRHAEKLLDAGLISKEYETEDKEIRYKLKYDSITFAFSKEGVVVDPSKIKRR